MNRDEWLASLKVGDEVAIGWETYPEIARVGRVTDTVIVANSLAFNRISGVADYCKIQLRAVTDADRLESKRSSLIARVSQTAPRALTTDQLARIVAILDESK